MKCPQCGFENPPGVMVCDCGREVETEHGKGHVEELMDSTEMRAGGSLKLTVAFVAIVVILWLLSCVFGALIYNFPHFECYPNSKELWKLYDIGRDEGLISLTWTDLLGQRLLILEILAAMWASVWLILPIVGLLIVAHNWLETQAVVVCLMVVYGVLDWLEFRSWGWAQHGYGRDGFGGLLLSLFFLLFSIGCFFAAFGIGVHRLAQYLLTWWSKTERGPA